MLADCKFTMSKKLSGPCGPLSPPVLSFSAHMYVFPGRVGIFACLATELVSIWLQGLAFLRNVLRNWAHFKGFFRASLQSSWWLLYKQLWLMWFPVLTYVGGVPTVCCKVTQNSKTASPHRTCQRSWLSQDCHTSPFIPQCSWELLPCWQKNGEVWEGPQSPLTIPKDSACICHGGFYLDFRERKGKGVSVWGESGLCNHPRHTQLLVQA